MLDKPTDEQLDDGFTFPAGYVHLPDVTSDEWIKQIVAEQQVIIRSRRGFASRTEWRQLRPRNEALDCRVYARAAVWLAGVDRWADTRWRALEIQLGLDEPEPRKPPPAPQASPSSAPMPPPVVAPQPAATGGIINARATMRPRRRRVNYWRGG